jgi:hypothetical protein
MDKPTGKDSFSWLYRTGYRVNIAMLHVMGPATQSPETDPLRREKREYERRRELHQVWKAHRRTATT